MIVGIRDARFLAVTPVVIIVIVGGERRTDTHLNKHSEKWWQGRQVYIGIPVLRYDSLKHACTTHVMANIMR